MHYHQKEVYVQYKVWEEIMQTDKLLNNYLIVYTSNTFHVFMPHMPGTYGVTEKTLPYRPDHTPTMIPNPCRYPAYHILHNTLLVHIRQMEGSVIIKILGPGGIHLVYFTRHLIGLTW